MLGVVEACWFQPLLVDSSQSVEHSKDVIIYSVTTQSGPEPSVLRQAAHANLTFNQCSPDPQLGLCTLLREQAEEMEQQLGADKDVSIL